MDNGLAIAMSAAVPLHIIQLQEWGGPSQEDLDSMVELAPLLGEKGDILLFGGGKKGECADLFNKTAHAIAVMAFCPGGIDIFGQHYEVEKEA